MCPPPLAPELARGLLPHVKARSHWIVMSTLCFGERMDGIYDGTELVSKKPITGAQVAENRFKWWHGTTSPWPDVGYIMTCLKAILKATHRDGTIMPSSMWPHRAP